MSESVGRAIDSPPSVAALTPRAGGLSWRWPAVCATAILYGSLVPFDFDWTAYQPADLFGLVHVALCRTTTQDLLVNVLLYVPMGLTLALGASRWHVSVVRRIAYAVVGGAVLSLLTETLQTGVAGRVASWTDVAMNALGTAIGALFVAGLGRAAASAARRLRRAMTDRPATTLASVLAVGLLLYGLMPFDFVTTTADLHASLGRARLDLTEPRPVPIGHPPFEPAIGHLAMAFWFAVLGYVLALADRESRRQETSDIPSAVVQGVVLAAVLECTQLFTKSHSFDIAAIVLRSLAVMIGVWGAGLTKSRSGRGHPSRSVGLMLPPWFLWGLAATLMTAKLLASFDPALWASEAIVPSRIQWVPLETLWRESMTEAVSNACGSLITYGTLSLALVLALTRIGARRVPFWTGGIVVLAAVAVETMRFFTPLDAPDLTGPVLAVIAAALTLRLHAAASIRPSGVHTGLY